MTFAGFSMPEQWYWKHRGNLLGPLETAELEQLIKRRRIGDRDQIRLTTSDDWMSGADVKALFAGRDGPANSAAAAAELLDRSIHPQQVRAGDAAGGPGLLDNAATGLRRFVGGALGGFGSAGGPLVDFISAVSTRLLAAGFMLFRLLANRAVLLCLAALVFNTVVLVQRQRGSDARNQRVFQDLNKAWQQWQALPTDNKGALERAAFCHDALPKWEAALKTLTSDAQRESLSSSNAFATSDRQRAVASARRALIQAIQEFQRLLKTPAAKGDTSQSTADFETYLALARDVMGNDYKYYSPKWTPQTAARFQSEIGASFDPWIVSVIVLDVGLVLTLVWFLLRRKRT